jgi:hypothetical protein
VIERLHLERLIGLERFKLKRAEWLREDMKSYFPFVRTIDYVGRQNSLASLYACRIAFDLPGSRPMSTKDRLELIRHTGLKMETLLLWDQRPLARGDDFFLEPFVRHDERLLIAYLTLLAQGHMAPQSLPGQKPKPVPRVPSARGKSPRVG